MSTSGSPEYLADVHAELGRTARGTASTQAARTFFAIDRYAAAGRADRADRVRAELAALGE